MTEDLDWRGLERVRAGYLGQDGRPGAALPDYWADERLLASYDATFAARIGWKWDAVLEELAGRLPASEAAAAPVHLYDWGCGTGIAARRCVAALGEDRVAGVHLHDRSARAVRFAAARLAQAAPRLPAAVPWSPADGFPKRPAVLLVSHVLTELDAAATAALVALAAAADLVVWVEPGTHAASRTLIAARERLRAEAGLAVVAPCTHQAACGLIAEANERHWCHHFARAPAEAFTESRWREFSERMRIDLRSLPVAFLVMRRGAPPAAAPQARVIGRAREYKAFHKLLACDAEGVRERTLQKRDDKALFKAIGKGAFTLHLPLAGFVQDERCLREP